MPPVDADGEGVELDGLTAAGTGDFCAEGGGGKAMTGCGRGSRWRMRPKSLPA